MILAKVRLAKTLLGSSAFFIGLSVAQASELSCYVPGFLTFELDTTATGSTVLKINQNAYGLRHGPATTLGQKLGVMPASGADVQSLSIHQDSGLAEFAFTDASTKTVELGDAVKISTHGEVETVGGVVHKMDVLTVTSEAGSLIRIPAQANLCQVASAPLKLASITEIAASFGRPQSRGRGGGQNEEEQAQGNSGCQSPPWPYCGHGSYAPPCCGN